MASVLLGVAFGLVLAGHTYKVRHRPGPSLVAYILALAFAVCAAIVRINTHGWLQ